MANIKTLIVENDKQELKVYVNDKNNIYLECGDCEEEVVGRGWIVLCKDDALALSEELKNLCDGLD